MKDIFFTDKILNAAPKLKVIQIEASVINCPTSDALWEEIITECDRCKQLYELSAINKRKGIAATRSAYKALGKDPNRYRPSSEALCRRIINGKGIYRLTTLIDVINLVSVASGYSIGGFDADKIEGDSLTLDRGSAEDEFYGIGRGLINIDGLPVYRDAKGSIGTPTSDEERTKLTSGTINLLMLVNVYAEDMPIEHTVSLIKDLLRRHASLSAFSVRVVSPATGYQDL